MSSDDFSNFTLFVGTAEWTQGPDGPKEDVDFYAEVSVDGSRQVRRTMYTKTAIWDENIKITGHISSVVSVEIRSVAHNSSESLSVARADTRLGHLLDICADGERSVPLVTVQRHLSTIASAHHLEVA